MAQGRRGIGRGAEACGGGAGWRSALPPCLGGGQRGRRRGRWWRPSARCCRPRVESSGNTLCMPACQMPARPLHSAHMPLGTHFHPCSFAELTRFASPSSCVQRPRPRRRLRRKLPIHSPSALALASFLPLCPSLPLACRLSLCAPSGGGVGGASAAARAAKPGDARVHASRPEDHPRRGAHSEKYSQ